MIVEPIKNSPAYRLSSMNTIVAYKHYSACSIEAFKHEYSGKVHATILHASASAVLENVILCASTFVPDLHEKMNKFVDAQPLWLSTCPACPCHQS